VQYFVQLFIAQDMTRMASQPFEPTFKNTETFLCDQNHRLKDGRNSLVTDPALSLKLIGLADRRNCTKSCTSVCNVPFPDFVHVFQYVLLAGPDMFPSRLRIWQRAAQPDRLEPSLVQNIALKSTFS
jgi:hypothetical protein